MISRSLKSFVDLRFLVRRVLDSGEKAPKPINGDHQAAALRAASDFGLT
jgi:hypothetical protein